LASTIAVMAASKSKSPAPTSERIKVKNRVMANFESGWRQRVPLKLSIF
jgi:hypothetical protein